MYKIKIIQSYLKVIIEAETEEEVWRGANMYLFVSEKELKTMQNICTVVLLGDLSSELLFVLHRGGSLIFRKELS